MDSMGESADSFVDYDLPGRGTTRFHWEYEQVNVEIATMADPPGSVPPRIYIRRRMVSDWEPYNPVEVA
jgi:hypothetical protein